LRAPEKTKQIHNPETTKKIHNEETKITETNEEESSFSKKTIFSVRLRLLRSFVVNSAISAIFATSRHINFTAKSFAFQPSSAARI